MKSAEGTGEREKTYARYVCGVLRRALEVWRAEIIGRVRDLIGPGDGGDEILLSRIIGHGSAVFGHVEEITALVGVSRRHFCGVGLGVVLSIG